MGLRVRQIQSEKREQVVHTSHWRLCVHTAGGEGEPAAPCWATQLLSRLERCWRRKRRPHHRPADTPHHRPSSTGRQAGWQLLTAVLGRLQRPGSRAQQTV